MVLNLSGVNPFGSCLGFLSNKPAAAAAVVVTIEPSPMQLKVSNGGGGIQVKISGGGGGGLQHELNNREGGRSSR